MKDLTIKQKLALVDAEKRPDIELTSVHRLIIHTLHETLSDELSDKYKYFGDSNELDDLVWDNMRLLIKEMQNEGI